MPKSATGANRPFARRSPRGFTLVELLVVLVIAALLGGLAILTLAPAGPEARAALALQRAAAAMDAMCDRALLEARPYGVRFHDLGYDFWVFDGADWQPLDDRAPPLAGRWAGGVEPRVEVERFDALQAVVASTPQVWCTGVEPPPPVMLETGVGPDRRRVTWPR